MPKTADRLAYEAIQRNQATMNHVNALLEQDSNRLLALGKGMGQQELGGYYRSVIPGLIDRWGKVNATAAMQYYDAQRLAWLQRNPAGQSRASRQNRSRQAERFAEHQLQSKLYTATMPEFDAVKIAEPIIGHGMDWLMKAGFGESKTAVKNALTRAVASYNRNTILYNSALDPVVIGVQRVAEPNACDFCKMMAFRSHHQYSNNFAANIRVADYAIEFHNSCHCSIETLYQGDTVIIPDYYKDFHYAPQN